MCAGLKDSWLLFPLSLKRNGYTTTLPESLHGTRKKALRGAHKTEYNVCNVVQHTLKEGAEQMPSEGTPVYMGRNERDARYLRIKLVAVHASNPESSRTLERGERNESAKEDEGDTNKDEIQHRGNRRPDTRPS